MLFIVKSLKLYLYLSICLNYLLTVKTKSNKKYPRRKGQKTGKLNTSLNVIKNPNIRAIVVLYQKLNSLMLLNKGPRYSEDSLINTGKEISAPSS